MNFPKVPLGSVVEILSGFAFKSDLFNDCDGQPLIRIRDVVRGYSDTFYSGNYANQYIVQNGEMIIGMDGKFNVARWNGGPALLNQRVCKITAIPGKIDDGYLFHYLPSILKAIEDATPFVTVKHLSANDLKSEVIPLPQLAEQRRIAAILDQADALRTKRRDALAQLDNLTQSIFIDMFGDPASNPKAWPVAPLSKLCTASGEYGAGLSSKDYDPSLPRYVRITDITDRGDLNDAPVSPSGDSSDWVGYELRHGDILFARSGATVGKTYKYNESDGPCVFAGYLIRFRPLETKVRSSYVFSFTQTSAYRSWVTARQRVVAQPNINAKQYGEDLLLPVPPLELQLEFERRLNQISQQKQLLKIAQQNHDTLFSSLQYRAFRGEL